MKKQVTITTGSMLNPDGQTIDLGDTVKVRDKQYGIGDNVLLDHIPGTKINDASFGPFDIRSILHSLNGSACKILLLILTSLNQRGELCRFEKNGYTPSRKPRVRKIPVETYKEFYESNDISIGIWNNFLKQVNPYHLLQRTKVLVNAGNNSCTRTTIIMNPAFAINSYNKITVESAVAYYSDIERLVATDRTKHYVLTTMQRIGKCVQEQLESGVNPDEIILQLEDNDA